MLIEAALAQPTRPSLQRLIARESNQWTRLRRISGARPAFRWRADLSSLSKADVLIDFTRPEATRSLARLHRRGVNMVIGTTGSMRPASRNQRRSRKIAIVLRRTWSRRQRDAEAARPGRAHFERRLDVEIIETHHKHKVDAPSGTALNGRGHRRSRGEKLNDVALYAREGEAESAKQAQSVFRVRGGDVIGDHTCSSPASASAWRSHKRLQIE